MAENIKFIRHGNSIYIKTRRGIEVKVVGITAISICGLLILLGAVVLMPH